MKNINVVLISFCLLVMSMIAHGQVQTAGIDVSSSSNIVPEDLIIKVLPNKENWQYNLNEPIHFKVSAFSKQSLYKSDLNVSYTIGLEKQEPSYKGSLVLENGEGIISVKPLDSAGFLRCTVLATIQGKAVKGVATAAFAPENIKATAKLPVDFSEFWRSTIEKSKSIPLNTKFTAVPSRSTADVNVYQVEYEFYNDGIQKCFAILCLPKREGRFPAIVRLPGAGWAPLAGDVENASKGLITLDVYIHGRSVLEDKAYYEDLQQNALKGYQFRGADNRDSSYYKNVILGCVRAVDFIFSLDQFDGVHVGAWGSSQGGALSIITTSLDKRIQSAVALCPAMCDYTGYLHGRAGGWPHFFANKELYLAKKDKMIDALAYYDVVNFARNIRVPMYFSWGFNDQTTPPTSFYSAYNVVTSAKEVFILPEGEHQIYPLQRQKTYAWLIDKLRSQ